MLLVEKVEALYMYQPCGREERRKLSNLWLICQYEGEKSWFRKKGKLGQKWRKL